MPHTRLNILLDLLIALLLLATVVGIFANHVDSESEHTKQINELKRQLNQAQTTSDSLRKHCK